MYGLFGSVSRTQPLPSKDNMEAGLSFAELHPSSSSHPYPSLAEFCHRSLPVKKEFLLPTVHKCLLSGSHLIVGVPSLLQFIDMTVIIMNIRIEQSLNRS